MLPPWSMLAGELRGEEIVESGCFQLRPSTDPAPSPQHAPARYARGIRPSALARKATRNGPHSHTAQSTLGDSSPAAARPGTPSAREKTKRLPHPTPPQGASPPSRAQCAIGIERPPLRVGQYSTAPTAEPPAGR